MFSSKSFIVSGLIIHLDFNLRMVLGGILILFIFMQLSSFPSTTYWRHCLFSIVYSCRICHKLGDRRCVGFLFCFINLYFSFCAIPYAVLITVALWYSLNSRSLIPPALFLFFFFLNTNYKLFCSNSVKNAIGNLIGIAFHSSVLAWRVPGKAELGGLPSLGSHRVGHDWSDLAAAAAAGLL